MPQDVCHRVTKLIICPTHLRILWQTHWSSWAIQEKCLSNVCWLCQLKWLFLPDLSDKISGDGGCHAWVRSRLLYLEHLVITSISYQCTSIACVINLRSIFVYNLDLSNYLLESALWYFWFLTLSLLLVYFASAAGCHCLDELVIWWRIIQVKLSFLQKYLRTCCNYFWTEGATQFPS